MNHYNKIYIIIQILYKVLSKAIVDNTEGIYLGPPASKESCFLATLLMIAAIPFGEGGSLVGSCC
jgi:hypothetical protein